MPLLKWKKIIQRTLSTPCKTIKILQLYLCAVFQQYSSSSSSNQLPSMAGQQLQMALLMKTSRKPSKFIVLTWTILQVPYNFFTTTHASAMLNILCHDATTLVSLENGFQCFKYVLQCRVIYLKGIDQKTGIREGIQPMNRVLTYFLF